MAEIKIENVSKIYSSKEGNGSGTKKCKPDNQDRRNLWNHRNVRCWKKYLDPMSQFSGAADLR